MSTENLELFVESATMWTVCMVVFVFNLRIFWQRNAMRDLLEEMKYLNSAQELILDERQEAARDKYESYMRGVTKCANIMTGVSVCLVSLLGFESYSEWKFVYRYLNFTFTSYNSFFFFTLNCLLLIQTN